MADDGPAQGGKQQVQPATRFRDEGSQRGARDGRACVVEIDPDRICSDPVALLFF
jgi:hypothetical protein